ncbi:MAG: cation:proton antiporter subunit C [Bacteroidales bacterium]|nr:cation:proton antiporter subunit C [Bacteroidales bacterium]
MKYFSVEYISIFAGFILLLIGLWGIISQKNILKIIISFSIIDTSIHLILVSVGYIKNRTAPIIDGPVTRADAAQQVTDPVPQALVLTAIVIGVGITALMLSYALKLYEKNKSLEIDKYKSLKW